MVIHGPDQLLWKYLELRQKLGSASARQTVVDRGLVFGDRCSQCKAPKGDARLEERDEKTGASRWVCSKCAAVWPVDIQFLLRNEFQSTRKPDAAADLYSLLGTYSVILSGLPLREQRVYLLLYLYENVGGYDQVAKEANRRWPRSSPPYGTRGPRPDGWTEWTVRRCVTDARRRINGELRARQLKPAAG